MEYKRYLQWLLGILSILAIPCVLNTIFLYHSGEFTSVDTIAAQQLNNEIIFASTVTHDLTYPYKLALYKTIKPEIVVIGSSRVMPFRQEMFTSSFVNMSRAMNSVDQGYFLISDMLKIHVPKIAIIGLDYWWFLEKMQKNIHYYTPPDDKAIVSFKLLFKPFLWLFQHKISWSHYCHTVLSPWYGKNTLGVGLNAQVKREGFVKDGSYYHVGVATGAFPSEDRRFEQTLSHILEGRGYLGHYQTIDPLAIERLKGLLQQLQVAGVKTIVFMPPIAPTPLAKIAAFGHEYDYIDDLFQQLHLANISFFNFHHAQSIPSFDCEFWDGYHGGDVVYLKMLKAMASDERNSDLRLVLNRQYVDTMIAQYPNRVLIPNALVATQAEIDFLQLGCQKS